MFFRRMFSRKSTNHNGTSAPLNASGGGAGSAGSGGVDSIGSGNQHNRQQSARLPSYSPSRKLQRRLSSGDKRGLSVLQLTPLWEHIIRTRALPEDLNPMEMFEEFLERLRDPEWQVRQHALRVLVDVLLVIGQKADSYFSPIIPQLVENLGHPAPTVRKGALDCLKVYVSNTAMPETILLEILDIGLNQRITNEPFGGRLTCGVMLSLPSLIQATLHTSKRNYILRTTIDMLISKMTQITHQEITLKVLLRIKDLIGTREFAEYMSHGAFREFDLLCNVYGLDNKKTSDSNRGVMWTQLGSFESEDSDPIWHLSEEGMLFDSSDNGNDEEYNKDKIIMETEIKIKDDTLTMRILETNTPPPKTEVSAIMQTCSSNMEFTEPIIVNDVLENTGIIKVLSDSELDESNGNMNGDNNDSDDMVRRTPKRVTFGGEIVKMRTPDSDTVTHSDADDITTSSSAASNFDKLNFLTVEIPNDNTKPAVIQSPVRGPNKITYSPVKDNLKSPSTATTSSEGGPTPPMKPSTEQNRTKSASPKSPFRRISVSPVDDIISPQPPHKEIEVLHNLQRSPCPSPGIRAKRRNSRTDSSDNEEKKFMEEKIESTTQSDINSWEDLGLVDENVIKNLKSGDWRHRSNAICSIEDALKSSENLALGVPYLDSLLRALLSSERNAEVIEDKRRVIMNLITRIPLDNLENRTNQIITGLCRQGGAGSNLVCKLLMQRMHPAAVVLKLLSDDFLHARSSRFRENALQMVMFALMTFPSTCFDTNTCVVRATYAALDRKKRVRQASLDVLAILGQIASPRSVMEIVQSVGKTREDGDDLCAAVKARLARKQLPIISPNGLVQYALRVPSPQLNDPKIIKEMGADIEWITSGVGSVSPTSMKRRVQRYSPNDSSIMMNGKSHHSDIGRTTDNRLTRLKAPHEILGMGVGVKNTDDSGTSDEKGNLQHSLATGVPLQMKAINTGDIIGIHGKRIATKSCSDSSQDGRSSDSTNSDSLRNIRSNITSRFPTMERLEVSGIYLDRQAYRNPYSDLQRLNSTFPKSNFSIHQKRKTNYSQDTYTESSFDESPYQVIKYPVQEVNGFQNARRFTNVEKFITQRTICYDETTLQLRKAQDFLNEKSSVLAKSTVEIVPHFFHICCCFYCCRKRKSIGVIQENNAESKQQGTPVIPIAIAPDVNKPPQQQQQQNHHQQQQQEQQQQQQQQQQLYVMSDNIHSNHLQENDERTSRQIPTEEGVKKIETHSKIAAVVAPPKTPSSPPRPQSPSAPLPPEQQQYSPQECERPTTGNDDNNKMKRKPSISPNKEEELSMGEGTPIGTRTNGGILKSNELSLEERFSSGHSTPTRIFDGAITPASVHSDMGQLLSSMNASYKTLSNKSAPQSRVQSLGNLEMIEGELSIPPISKHSLGNDNDQVVRAFDNKVDATDNVDNALQLEDPIKDINQEIQLNDEKDASIVHFIDESKMDENDLKEKVPESMKGTDNIQSNLVSSPLATIIGDTASSPIEQKNLESLGNSTAAGFNMSPSKNEIVIEKLSEILEDELESIGNLEEDAIKVIQSPISTSPIPTMEVKSITRESSVAKSSESIFDEPVAVVKPEGDNKSITSTETSSDYQPSHTASLDEPLQIHNSSNFIPLKTRPAPLMRRSKTTLFARNRKVSPVKQSIKLCKTELFPQTLTRFDRPKEAFNQSIAQLGSDNWETIMKGLHSFVRLMRHHPELLDIHMHMVCIQLARSVKNLRSQVARASCQACTELFLIRSKHLEQECDDLVGNLLHRTADTNRFLRSDATRALESMCDSLNPSKVLQMLTTRGATHQNATVRTATAKLLNRLADRIGCERIFNMHREHRDRLILTGANLLMEGSLETRSYAKALFRLLSSHHNYSRLLLEIIPSRTYRNIEKTLKNIK